MKAPPFAYARPTTIDGALRVLADGDGAAKVLAGGQSLVPMLAMRLARPATLVDVNGVRGLDVLRVDGDHLEIGATVRQRAVERSPAASAVPLLGLALPWIGHRELRSRGTVCGSLAHADPAAELPAVACCLDASLVVAGPAGVRQVPAVDFFAGAMTTALGPDEILTAVRFPRAAPGDGFGFAEVARRHGDFALAGVAVRAAAAGTVRLSAFGVSDRPVCADVTEPARQAATAGGGQPGVAAALLPAMTELATRLVDTAGDPHASTAYRQHLLAHLAADEVGRAVCRSARDRWETGR